MSCSGEAPAGSSSALSSATVRFSALLVPRSASRATTFSSVAGGPPPSVPTTACGESLVSLPTTLPATPSL
jgi:hypothetical protein